MPPFNRYAGKGSAHCHSLLCAFRGGNIKVKSWKNGQNRLVLPWKNGQNIVNLPWKNGQNRLILPWKNG